MFRGIGFVRPVCVASVILLGASCQFTPGSEVSPLTSLPPSGSDCPVQRPQGVVRPAVICGTAGYAYLWAMYLRPQCGGCHYQGSFIHWNGFGDPDVSTAVYFMQYYSKEPFVQRVMKNDFLLDSCELREGDPLLDDLRYWFDHRTCS